MWSLTSQRERRTGGPENIQSSAKKDFFNTIRQKRSFHNCYLVNWISAEGSDLMACPGTQKPHHGRHPSRQFQKRYWKGQIILVNSDERRTFLRSCPPSESKRADRGIYDFTAPAVIPSIKRRCSSTKTNTTGSTMITAAASISPQSVEYCPVKL